MRARRRTLIALALLAGLLLVGCAGLGTSEDDGTLGGKESPADLYVAMAQEYYRRGQMDAALQRAEHAVKVDGKNARARYMLAFLYQRLGETERAEKQFREAVSLDPKNPDIRNAWGTFFCAQKRYAEADEQFNKALENPLYATPEVALTNAGICARQAGDTARAQAYFGRASSANPRFGPALFESARLSYERGDYTAARASLDRYFEIAPMEPSVLLLAVRVERQLGNRKRAATYEQTLRKRFPNAPEVLQLRGS
jgi:type IV pilus assembly protein PilF